MGQPETLSPAFCRWYSLTARTGYTIFLGAQVFFAGNEKQEERGYFAAPDLNGIMP